MSHARGSALLLALIIVILVAGLGGAFLAESLAHGKRQFAAVQSDEAQLHCDAGLEKARRVLLERRNADPSAWNELLALCQGFSTDAGAILRDFVARGPQPRPATSTAMPADPAEFFGVNVPYSEGAYHVVLRDNEDFHGDGVDHDGDGDPWNPDDPAGLELAARQTSPALDGDRQAILVITATLPDRTQRQIEVLVEYPTSRFRPNAALLDNGTIQMNGSFQVRGAQGLVHANEDVIGNASASAWVDVSVNASASADGLRMANAPPGGINSGVAPVPIPDVDLAYWRTQRPDLAPYMIVLGRDGTVTDYYGSPVSAPFAYQNGTWTISGGSNTVRPALYYVEGHFQMTGQGGADPYEMTILAEGSVDLGGNSSFRPFRFPSGQSTNVLAVAGQDLVLRGTGTASGYQYEGVTLAGEQVLVRGNFTMNGSIVGRNKQDTPGSLVTTSSAVEADAIVGGNPVITYHGLTTFIPNPAQSVLVRSVRRLK